MWVSMADLTTTPRFSLLYQSIFSFKIDPINLSSKLYKYIYKYFLFWLSISNLSHSLSKMHWFQFFQCENLLLSSITEVITHKKTTNKLIIISHKLKDAVTCIFTESDSALKVTIALCLLYNYMNTVIILTQWNCVINQTKTQTERAKCADMKADVNNAFIWWEPWFKNYTIVSHKQRNQAQCYSYILLSHLNSCVT